MHITTHPEEPWPSVKLTSQRKMAFIIPQSIKTKTVQLFLATFHGICKQMTKDRSNFCALAFSDMIGKHFQARDMQMKRQFFAKLFAVHRRWANLMNAFRVSYPAHTFKSGRGRLAWEHVVAPITAVYMHPT